MDKEQEKHTPAHWTVTQSDEYTGNYVIEEATIEYREPVHEANVRLISAAPELLEACEMALYVLGECTVAGEKLSECFPLKVKALRAAIAKAKAKGQP